ncbi:MAG TPA: FHA domain-containing protein [Flavisolibacter sp.]|jgi:hypothetical protein|nr:FHA domain-containing protein [Flavisolibacter sp.]
MLDLFKSNETRPQDVKELRSRLLQFIKSELGRLEDGEGKSIRSIQLFLLEKTEDLHLHEAAVYAEDELRFKNEVQRIADDFALDLPEFWNLEVQYVDSLPAEAIKAPGMEAALFIQTRKRSIQKSATAYITVMNGEAEKELYEIRSTSGRITIGREKKVQVEEGFFRINTIAFPASSQHASNKYISRQHAHIEFENDLGCFILFADEGGIPPRNKIKIKSLDNPDAVKLHSMEIGHVLQEGDQIILGDSAVLAFSYSNTMV